MFAVYANRLDEYSQAWVAQEGWRRHIAARGLNLITAPIGLVARILDIAIGVLLATPFNLLTVGKITELNNYTNISLNNLDNILGSLALNILRFINPQAKVDFKYSLTNKLDDALASAKEGNAEHPFNHHVTNRFNSIIFAIYYLVTRAVDLVFGVLGLLLATVTLGTKPVFNGMAYSALAFPGIIHDVYRCGMLLVNPATIA